MVLTDIDLIPEEIVKLNVKALGLAFGLTWGGTVLVLGIANVIWPFYGSAVLELAASIYPGYDATAPLCR